MNTPTDKMLQSLVEAVAGPLTARGWMLAAAESCTGGWVAKCCTDLAGSSAWFDRAFVTYTNEAKQEMLGVSAGTLDGHGAVSRETVVEMAHGALTNSRASVSVAISGIAGPTGGSEEKPVGTVWFAWAMDGAEVVSECGHFDGDREAVRRQAVAHALAGVRKQLDA